MAEFEIAAGGNVLTADGKRGVSAFDNSGGRVFSFSWTAFWKIKLQEPSDSSVRGRKFVVKSARPDMMEQRGEEIFVLWRDIQGGEDRFRVKVEMVIKAGDDAFTIRANIQNEEDKLIVKEMEFPSIDAPLRPGRSALLLPDGAGRKYLPGAEPLKRELRYVSMSCVLIDHGGGEVLYMGLHDRSFTDMKIKTIPSPDNKSLRCSFSIICWTRPGESWESPPAVLAFSRAGWENAVQRYRRWAEEWFAPPSRPAWTEDVTGWILCIMKQQNGEIIWDWDDIDVLCDLAEKQGLNMLGLYGWTEGGHDRHYPECVPMGKDDEKVKAAIKKAHQRGIKVILYTNGQLIDIQGDDFKREWEPFLSVSERGEAYIQNWQKYRDAPMKAHALACQGASRWREKLVQMAEQVNGLGADGIIYDQIGFGGALDLCCCFSTVHGHKNPGRVNVNGIIESLKLVQKHMEALNPDFILMSEGAKDCIAMHLDLIWGWAGGYSYSPNSFPPLFFTAFPEYRGFAIQRIPAPVQDDANLRFARDNGFLFEVEFRYRADRDLAEGRDVSSEDYEDDDVKVLPAVTGVSFEESAGRIMRAVKERARGGAAGNISNAA